MANAQLANGVAERKLLGALRAVKRGDFSVRLPLEQSGAPGELAEAFNDVIELLDASTREVERISQAAWRKPVAGGE